MKNPKIAKDSTNTKVIEKFITDLESLEFFNACLIKFKNNQILHIKISHRFVLTTKQFAENIRQW
jgi:hypothetical protein